ncbi:hypothetical protein D3C75_990440 [compost metagenome]
MEEGGVAEHLPVGLQVEANGEHRDPVGHGSGGIAYGYRQQMNKRKHTNQGKEGKQHMVKQLKSAGSRRFVVRQG